MALQLKIFWLDIPNSHWEMTMPIVKNYNGHGHIHFYAKMGAIWYLAWCLCPLSNILGPLSNSPRIIINIYSGANHCWWIPFSSVSFITWLINAAFLAHHTTRTFTQVIPHCKLESTLEVHNYVCNMNNHSCLLGHYGHIHSALSEANNYMLCM